jgi:hypothetical protein
VEENRTTWLLLAMIAVAGRLATDDPDDLTDCFSTRPLLVAPAPVPRLTAQPES